MRLRQADGKQKYNFLPKFPLTDKKISPLPQRCCCRMGLLAAFGIWHRVSGYLASGIRSRRQSVPCWVAVGSILAMGKVPAIRCPHPYPLECTPGHISVDNSTNLLDCPHLAPSERSRSGGTVDNELQEPPQHPDTYRNIPDISQIHSGILIHNDSASAQIHTTTHSLYICILRLSIVNFIYTFCGCVKYFYICSNINCFNKL